MTTRAEYRDHTAVLLVRVGTALLTLAAIASLVASPDRAATAPLTALVALGSAAVWGAAGARPAGERATAAALWTFLALGYACVVVMPLIVEWPSSKLPGLAPLYRLFPSLLPWAPTWVGAGLSSNQMGGVLAGCIAFAATLLMPWRVDGSSEATMRGLRRAALPLVALGTPILVASGSRAAAAALMVAVFVVAVKLKTRLLWALPTAVAAVAAFVLVRPGEVEGLVHRFLHEEPLQTKLLARVDIWTSAVKGIADHPFAGIGLGTLNEVLPVRYPYGVVGLDYSVTQAHNIVLDTALSMGLVGAAGLLLALGGALWCGLRGDNNRADPGTSTAGTRAFTAVLITFTVFGTTDSLGFSSASSLVFWAALAGLIWVSRGEGSAPHT